MAKMRRNRRINAERGPAGARRRIGGEARPGIRRDVLGVVLLATGLTLGLALLSYSAIDGQLIARGLPAAGNLAGPVGHAIADGLFRGWGFAALVIPVALCLAAFRLLKGAPPRVTLVGAFAFAVLAISTASVAHIAFSAKDPASFPPGGSVGSAVGEYLQSLFSSVGGVLLAVACGLVSLIVAVDLKVGRVATVIYGTATLFWGWLGTRLAEAVQRHREAIAELRTEEAEMRRLHKDGLATVVQANGPAAEAEARAVARELAGEHVRRGHRGAPLEIDPAWVDELSPAARPRRKRPGPRPTIVLAGAKAKGEPALPPAGEPTAELPLAPEGGEAVLGEGEPLEPPRLPAGRPQIVLSPAMQAGAPAAADEKKKKVVPSFAYTQSGEVFRLPPLGLLEVREAPQRELDEEGLRKTAQIIVATLRTHGVEGSIGHIRPGPVVTLFEFSPMAGIRLSRIEGLGKELTMALSATRIRIIAPIPGKGVVGIEVPNGDRTQVYLKGILESETFTRADGLIPLALGKDIEGFPYWVDLQKMPHLLIAGTTGSGKSVGLNTMILSMLHRQTPDQIRMIMVDPKMTELRVYADIPHLLLPVVTDPSKAARALQWAVTEMERRTQILADTGVRDLKGYNAKVERARSQGKTLDEGPITAPKKLLVVDVSAGETEEDVEARIARGDPAPEPVEPPPLPTAPYEDPVPPPDAQASDEKKLPQKLPYIVVVIDELADLMMTAPREVEICLARLAQKARATGIHLIVATQRPSTDVITGNIKNNFPARISFRLASRHDSTTIINGPGAETLLGDGDMLVMTATNPITRVQGAFVSEEEIHRVVGFLKEQGKPVYDESILKARESDGDGGREDDENDPVYEEAMELVLRMEEVSVSKLQREMRLGYNKAAKIIERMEREGVVGPANGVKPRQVLMRPPGEANPIPNV
jgi:S-DNA-T family DNA segregation ATPase FtsK/SpoIIIE